MISKELEKLQTLLVRGDTSVFFPLWNNVKWTLLRDFYGNFEEFLKKDAFRCWMRYVRCSKKQSDCSESILKLDWLSYFIDSANISFSNLSEKYKIGIDKTAEEIQIRLLKEFKKMNGFKELDASGVIGFLPTKLITSDRTFSTDAKIIGEGIFILYTRNKWETFHNFVTKIIYEFENSEKIGVDKIDVLDLIARYSKDVYDQPGDSSVFKGKPYDKIKPILSQIHESQVGLDALYDILVDRTSKDIIKMVEEFESTFIGIEENLWKLVVSEIPPTSDAIYNEMRDTLIPVHFKRMYNAFDCASTEEEKVCIIIETMCQFIARDLGDSKNDIYDKISQRLEQIAEDVRNRIKHYWGRRDIENEKNQIIRDLREICNDVKQL